jgi:hypothetical protein
MKINIKLIVTAFTLMCFFNLKAQTTQLQNELEGTPNLTYSQMLADHDSLVSYIKQVSPIIYFNKQVRGIDFNKHAKKIRKQITPKTTMPEYLRIVLRTINSAQDNHTSLMWPYLLDVAKKYWLAPTGNIKGIDTLDMTHHYKYWNYLIGSSTGSKLKLNLVYTDGEYHNLLPFEYNGKKYPYGLKLLKCNNVSVHKVINHKEMEQLLQLSWDRKNNRVYNEGFYTLGKLFKKDTLRLTFSDSDNNNYQLNIAKKDTVNFLEKKYNKFGFNSSYDVVTHYFEKEQIFYAKLPQMDPELADTLVKRFKAIIDKHSIKSVVLDVRGNGGGSDETYQNFLSKLLKDTVTVNIKVGRVFSPYNCKYFEINADTIINSKNASFTDKGPKLKNVKMVYTTEKFDYVIPDKEPFTFDGNIYILQDRFIYSSTSNLSSLAFKTNRLISVGEMPDALGGIQTNVSLLYTPYSKIFFRVEPQIDFTDCKTVADIFQNQVEHFVPYPIDFLHDRATTTEDILGKNFLLQKDPMFKKVLALELQY